MIVALHALGGIATAAALSPRANERVRPVRLVAGFALGILLHGILDVLPHNYPLAPPVDVLVGLVLLGLGLAFARPSNRLLVLVCFLGALFPDLFDHGPLIAERRFGLHVPHLQFKVFPWHWKEFSGSIYDDSNRLGSAVSQLAVAGVSVAVMTYRRAAFFRFRKSMQP